MALIEDEKQHKCKPNSMSETLFAQILATELNTLLAQGACVITSNQRLSRFRLKQFEEIQIQQDKQAWETPTILPWFAWLQQQWQQFGTGVWLNAQQESLLWQNRISGDETTEVLNPKALAKQAMQAWNILADYHINPTCLQHEGEEHQALWRWGTDVQKKTTGILQHQILGLLCETNATPPNIHKQTFILDGFDSFSPAQTCYFKHLETLGHQVFELYNDTQPATCSVTVYTDPKEELRQVCQHIRTYSSQHPDQNIGVFIPDLERRIAAVNSIFSEELSPALILQHNPDLQGEYFNISYGSILAKQPMVKSVLAMLALTVKPHVQHQELSQLLLNPYVQGYHEEAEQRALWDVSSRKNNQYQLSLSQLIFLCKQAENKIPLFVTFIQQLLESQSSLSGKHVLSYWMTQTNQILDKISWFEQAHSPHEYAQIQSWHELIQKLSCLDDYCGEITWHEALGRLQEHAHEQLFRPAPGQANIQIMGLLEAANLHFDHAFLLGMDDNTWPPTAKPNPLIPFHIQVLHQTPHANSEREWAYAQTVWQHIQLVSPTLNISYAKTKDSAEVQASPLLRDLKKEDALHQTSSRYAITLQQQPTNTQPILEESLTVQQSESIKGGTGILKSQSACAFQAFARYRLHLYKLETPSLGLNASEQGILLHAALEDFWSKAKTQATLITWIENEQLVQEVKISIQNAWNDFHRLIPLDIKALESKRLQHLILQWLELERQREPFSIQSFEIWKSVRLGETSSLLLNTKIDRIDRSESGKHIVLDYKTGITSAHKTLGHRPDEPQLPIYEIAERAAGVTIDAVAFAQVRNHDCVFKGFAQEDGILPKIKAYKGKKDEPEDWSSLTQHWQDTLNKLVDEFMIGGAEVEPKNTQSCTYCEFKGLCRVKF